MTVAELTNWINSLGRTDQSNVLEFMELIKISHQSGLVLGLMVNITPRNEITFDTQKVSYSAVKRLMLDKCQNK